MSLFDMLETADEPVVKQKKEKEQKKKVEKEVKKTSIEPSKTFTYPFRFFMNDVFVDVSHIFEDGKTYSEDEISKAMLEHCHYAFSGKVSYELREDENILIPFISSHRKG